jgi:hypothetical protein
VLPVSLAAGTRSVLCVRDDLGRGPLLDAAATVKIGKSLAFGSAVPAAVVDESYCSPRSGTRLVAP